MVVFTIKNDFDSTLSINKLLTKIHWFEVYIIKPSDHHKQQNNNRKIQQHHTVVIVLTRVLYYLQASEIKKDCGRIIKMTCLLSC